ncbi:hypothetical protein [Winogradskyella ouciana]|uniref:DUF1566 domain-containing protein n=1 Tax=Winogradskyella ouciana TaxID=2608631 RepID=A0A7K1G885_9FLAO|nr:hypothetical protein [Winogradskyella ouciana]MTE25496.1 hypothetical protein [Winogradskyella ouciana]
MYYVLTENLSFEIASEDLPEKLDFENALNLISETDDRWRLPNIEELNLMFKLHSKAVGNFKYDTYISSEGINNYNYKSKSFIDGSIRNGSSYKKPPFKNRVRLIRNI